MIVQAPTTAGRTSQPFGSSPGGYNPAGGHTGEDIALDVGTPLGAMADGVVVHAGTFAGNYWDNEWLIVPEWAGFVVIVDYGSFLSLYCHCKGSPVQAGDRVRRGQTVAYSGNTGSATSGPHLHWETMPDGWDYQNGTYGRINPRSLLTAGGISPAGSIVKERKLSTAEVQEIKNYVHALLIGGYTSAGKAHPGIGMVVEENQRRIGAVPAKVWSTPVRRGGKDVSVLQELADAKTLAQTLQAKVAALSTVLQTVASGNGSDVDLAAVTAAAEAGAAKALAGLTATVTIAQEPAQ